MTGFSAGPHCWLTQALGEGTNVGKLSFSKQNKNKNKYKTKQNKKLQKNGIIKSCVCFTAKKKKSKSMQFFH